jgi:Tfp pilus assembly protein PilX
MMGSAENRSVRVASHDAASERGMALLTVMIIMLLMVVLAISAITVTGLETRMSGFVATKEAMSTAAESCEGTAVNIIQQALYYGEIKPEFLSTATPAGPIPAANSATLFSEISGQPLPSPAPPNTIGENYARTDGERGYRSPVQATQGRFGGAQRDCLPHHVCRQQRRGRDFEHGHVRL